jgi:predicted lactoylglutathione lyase
MSTFTPNVAAITLSVEDRERSKAFYTRAFAADPDGHVWEVGSDLPWS